MPDPTLTVLIPAYNEGASLSCFLPEAISFCKKHQHKLIVVNDGSSDDTAEILDQYLDPSFMTVIQHKLNRGYGGAIKSGIRATDTDYVVTVDADGQHILEDVEILFAEVRSSGADMMVGSRKGLGSSSMYRSIGKRLIRFVANILLDVPVYDINSGMKILNTKLAQKYLSLCPDSMAFSEVITLVFISDRHLVVEHPIRIRDRIAGSSTITTATAFETMMEILNIVVLFNPIRIFLPISLLSLLLGVLWGLPIVLRNGGISVGAMLGIVPGIIFFFLGLLAEQISMIRRDIGS
jgi:glycosyltransferase involved in cell wall biosynthesis